MCRFFVFLCFFWCFVGGFAPVSHAQSVSNSAPTFLDDEAEENVNVSFTLEKLGNFAPNPPAATPSARLLFDYQDANNFYSLELRGHSVAFVLTRDAKRTLLSRAAFAPSAKNALVLQRRTWLMQLLVNDQVVLRAFDATWNEGQIGSSFPASSGLKATDFRVQPTEDVRFDDDFTRAGAGGDNDWKTVSGAWKLSASSEQVNSRNANMSSNPFAYEVETPRGEALATSGRWFWSAYDARVSVRPFGRGEVGIAAYVKDPKNHLSFRWSATESPSARRLIWTRNGVETVLASGRGAYFSRQWYEIGLRLSPGFVEAILDGVPVLRAQTEVLGQGGIGLWAKNIENAAFDDVRVRSYDFLRPLWAQNGAWQRQGGNWQMLGATAKSSGAGILTLGAQPARNFRAFVSLPVNGGGLVAGWRDAKNYSLFRMQNGRAQIVRYQNGAAKIERDAPQNLAAGRDAARRISSEIFDGVWTVSSGDTVLAQTSGAHLNGGKFGLASQTGAPLEFKDPVLFFPPPPEPVKVAARMETDSYMVGWASPTGEWPPIPGKGGLEFWNTGDYFGDFTLEFPWRAAWTGRFEISLRARRGEFDSGLILRAQGAPDRQNVTFELRKGEEILAKTPVKLADLPDNSSTDGAVLRLSLRGESLVLASKTGPILEAMTSAAQPSTSQTAIAVRSAGFRVRADQLRASALNRDDYTFTGAPTDFYSLGGFWSIFARWPCYGDWSFFGGDGRNPVLWTKRQYSGDVVAEMYAHPQMILPKEPGYSHPGDLNITLAGDGKNLSSGYSFIVSGWDNTRTALKRGDQIVAVRSDEKGRFANTINHEMRWHRRWIYVRAEIRAAKRENVEGALVSLSIDEEKILEYFDAKPLEGWKNGGRAAFWTLDSTMMIARAKIEAQHFGNKSLPAGLLDAVAAPILPANAPLRAVSENELPSALISREGNGWRVQNPQSGGIFAVEWAEKIPTISRNSRLSFEAKLPPSVKIDLYAQIDGQWRTFEMGGGQKFDAFAPKIGTVRRVALDAKRLESLRI